MHPIFPKVYPTRAACATEVLREANVRISIDGKGRWMDNIMIEGLWRSLKYECVYLNAL